MKTPRNPEWLAMIRRINRYIKTHPVEVKRVQQIKTVYGTLHVIKTKLL